jgi:membrane-associated phospholipid phosphatase
MLGWCGRWLLLLLSVSLWAPAARGDDDAPPVFGPLWSDVGQELASVAVSPAEGTLPGYVVGAGFAGALVWGLHRDLGWYQAVQDHRTPVLDKVMPVATLAGDGWFEIGAFAALYQFGTPRDQAVAAQAVEGQIDVAVVATLLKYAFSASRPGTDDTRRAWFTGSFGDSSFPSGHSLSAFCTAAIVGHAYHAEWLTFPLAAVVAYSRVYNQAHWPSDAIAGAGLGTLIGYTVAALHDQAASPEPAIRFTAVPLEDGASVVVSWRY